MRLARNTALSLVAIGLLGASRLLYNVVVGRRFGLRALGDVTLAVNAGMFASLLVSGGWQVTTARYVAQALGRGEPGQASTIFRRTLLHNTAGGLVAGGVLAAVLGRIPGVGLGARDVALAAVILFSYNSYQHLKAASYGFGRVGEYLLLELLSSGALLAGLAAVAVAHARPWLLVPAAGGYAIFSLLAFARLLPAAGPRSPIDKALWREIRGFTALAIVGTVASAGFLNLAPVFAGHYASRVEVGRFGAALAIVIPVYFLPRALSLALFPSIAFRHGQQRTDSVRRQLDVSGRTLAILLCAPTAVAAIVARPLLGILFGASYKPGADVLAILLAATYLSVVQIPYVTTLSGTERRWYKVPVIASVIGFAIGIVLWVVLGRAYGSVGIAWGYLIGSVPQAAIPIAFASRSFKVPIASVAVRSSIVWAAVLGARVLIGASPKLSTSLVAAAAVLAIFAALFARDLAGILRDGRGRLRGAA